MLPLAPLIDPNFDKLWAVTSSLENITDLLSGFSYWNISIVRETLTVQTEWLNPMAYTCNWVGSICCNSYRTWFALQMLEWVDCPIYMHVDYLFINNNNNIMKFI